MKYEEIDTATDEQLSAFVGADSVMERRRLVARAKGMVTASDARAAAASSEYIDGSDAAPKGSPNVIVSDAPITDADKPEVKEIVVPANGGGYAPATEAPAPAGMVTVSAADLQAMIAKQVAKELEAKLDPKQKKIKRLPEKVSDHYYDIRTGKVVPYTEEIAMLQVAVPPKRCHYIACAPNGGWYFVKNTTWHAAPHTGVIRLPIVWNPRYDNSKGKYILCDKFGSPVSKFSPELPTGSNKTPKAAPKF